MKFLLIAAFLSLSAMAQAPQYHLYNRHQELVYVMTFDEVKGSKEIHYSFIKPAQAVVTIKDKSNQMNTYNCEALTVLDEIFTRVNKITCSDNGQTFVLETQNIVDYHRDDLSIKYNGEWYFVW